MHCLRARASSHQTFAWVPLLSCPQLRPQGLLSVVEEGPSDQSSPTRRQPARALSPDPVERFELPHNNPIDGAGPRLGDRARHGRPDCSGSHCGFDVPVTSGSTSSLETNDERAGAAGRYETDTAVFSLYTEHLGM